ncbi:hypothetical protein WBP06_14800 [Novosphingobium sp. BL-8H]|uniref:hypothetical protein n=1 Tax=Novosphingobium sp. BL-8H TaxID=3127640 RepID=UPI003758450D
MDEPEIAFQPAAEIASPVIVAQDRREPREDVEIIANLRSAFATWTVVLKDLNRLGARVEGIKGLEVDEAVNLGLPGCRPAMAFVAWNSAHGTGLEFAEPLDLAVYEDLVERHGLGRQSAPAITLRPIG